ncbi:MAG TPA: DUF1707 domain-containing protein [Streptosporangiaceae bacterium]
MTPTRRPHDLRASDADRERVVAVLAEAASDGRLSLEEHAGRVQRAYSARTLGELAVLTEDLLAPSAQPVQLDESRLITAFFTNQRRSGRWIVPGRLTITAVGSQVSLDLTEAVLAEHHTILHATLAGGSLHLFVPPTVQVVVTDSRLPGRAGPDHGARAGVSARPGMPLIEVRAFTVAGRVRVHTLRRQGNRWLGRFPRRR